MQAILVEFIDICSSAYLDFSTFSAHNFWHIDFICGYFQKQNCFCNIPRHWMKLSAYWRHSMSFKRKTLFRIETKVDWEKVASARHCCCMRIYKQVNNMKTNQKQTSINQFMRFLRDRAFWFCMCVYDCLVSIAFALYVFQSFPSLGINLTMMFLIFQTISRTIHRMKSTMYISICDKSEKIHFHFSILFSFLFVLFLLIKVIRLLIVTLENGRPANRSKVEKQSN